MNFWKKPLQTAALLMAALLSIHSVAAEPELKGSPTELMEFLKGPRELPKRVNISGESEIKVQAEKAVITIRVTTENKLFEESLKSNQALRSRIFFSMIKSGLNTNDIQAAKFSSIPKQPLFGEKAKSYRVDNAMKLTVYNEKQFQAVAALVDSAPEIHFVSTDFEHSDKENLKAKALVQACENAVARKKMFEEALGVKLVPKSFNQSELPSAPPARAVDYGASKSDSYLLSTPLPGRVEMSTSFDELIFKSQITVEFAVESK